MWRAWVEGVIAGRQTGWASNIYRAMATLPSYCFAAAVKSRHFLYDQGLLATMQADVPVISVGNLVCGGTGKTQFVMLLAELLMQQGWRVGILSRGYKRRLAISQHVNPQNMHPSVCGDEPWMIAKRLPKACIVVGADRFQTAALAVAQGAEILLLDDGMQHRRLKRDVEIVMLDTENPFSSKDYLPKGRLRELPSRLKCADVIICIGQAPLKIRQWTHAPCVEVKIVHDGVFDAEGKAMPLPARVGLFCGLGHPQRFVQTVQELGCEVVETYFLADHQKITKASLTNFAKKAQLSGAEVLLCTEKDWVKGVFTSSLPIGWVRTKMITMNGEDVLKSIVERRCL